MLRSYRAGPRRWRLLLAAAFLSLPSTATAHGHLKRSIPAAGAHLGEVPRELRLEFSEAPDLTFSTVRLIGPDGTAVALGALGYPSDSHRTLVAAIAAALRPGAYTIAWQIAGDDGHPVRGRIEFVVAPGAMGVGVVPSGVAAAAPGSGAGVDTSMAAMHHDPVAMPEGNGFGADSAAYVLVRWVQFVALLLAIGAVSFHRFVLTRIRRDPASKAEPDEPAMLPVAERQAARIGMLASAALAVTLVARLVAQSYAMHGDANLFDAALMGPMIGRTMWGWGWLLELAGIAVAAAGFAGAHAHARDAEPARDAVAEAALTWWRVAAIGVVLLAFSPGMSSHASAAPRLRTLAMLADGAHVLAASTWLGTLSVALLAAFLVAARRGSAHSGAFARDLVNAFSPVALVAAGVAASTGTFAAWLHVGTIPNLWGTRYGVILLVKLAVLGLVALTGFYNWRIVQPRLGTPAATVQLRRSAIVEVGVALLVLLVTAVLVASPTSMDAAM